MCQTSGRCPRSCWTASRVACRHRRGRAWTGGGGASVAARCVQRRSARISTSAAAARVRPSAASSTSAASGASSRASRATRQTPSRARASCVVHYPPQVLNTCMLFMVSLSLVLGKLCSFFKSAACSRRHLVMLTSPILHLTAGFSFSIPLIRQVHHAIYDMYM